MNNIQFENLKFNKYIQSYGSKFAAIMYISSVARKLRCSVDNCISESCALTWAVTGEVPACVIQWRKQKSRKRNVYTEFIKDKLCYIDDVEVRDAVDASIRLSRSEFHLIYEYQEIRDENKKARVRIICNMIWDDLHKLRLDNML